MRSHTSLPLVLRLVLPVLAAVLCVVREPEAGARLVGERASAPRVREDGREPEALPASLERDEPETFDARLPIPRLGAREIRGGRRVILRWDALPPAVEELELLLSLDDGRSFAWRISPEIAGSEGAYAWDVPNLSAPSARVRIRAHVGGREVDGPAGTAFSIVAEPARPRERWSFREGGMPVAAESRRMPHHLRTTPGSRELCAPSPGAAVGPPVRAPGAGPARDHAGTIASRATGADCVTRVPFTTVTRTHPLRN